MKKLFVVLFVGMSIFAYSQSLQLYDSKGNYLGNLNNNSYDPNSISNPYGTYGSEYSPKSINNPYGEYGSPYSPESVTNPYSYSSKPTYRQKSKKTLSNFN